MSENTDIKVEFLVTPWDTWKEKYTAAFAGGNPPDVSYMTEWYPMFADANQLADFGSLITDDIRKRYSSSHWDYATYKGKTVGVPFICVDSVVFYNKEIFEKEKVEIPKNWEEFSALAKKLTKDANNDGKADQFGLAFIYTPEMNIHQLLPMVVANGATYLDKDEKQLGFNNPEGIKALEYGLELTKYAPPIDTHDENKLIDMFAKGSIAMFINQILFPGQVKAVNPDIKIGAFEIPASSFSDPVVARSNYGGIGMFSIAEASKNKNAAWELIQFITKPENEKVYLSKVNLLSPNEETNNITFGSDEIMLLGGQAAKSTVMYPTNPKWAQIDPVLKKMLEEIVRGVKPVDKAVSDANEKAKEILK